MTAGSISPKVVVLEPSLVDVRGHHFHAIRELTRALAPIRLVIVTNVRMNRSVLPADLQVHRLFTRTVYDETDYGPRPETRLRRRIWKMRQVADPALRIFRQFRALSTEGTNRWTELRQVVEETNCREADHIILPTATPDLILELDDILRETPQSHSPQVHARVLNADRIWHGRDVDRMFARLAGTPAESQSVHLYVEMPAMQNYLAEKFRIKSGLFPFLLNESSSTRAIRPRTLSRSEPVHFAFLGTPSRAKGYYRLVPIFRALAADPAFDPKRCRFIIQIGYLGKPGERLARELEYETRRFDIDLEVHNGMLSPEDYAALLDRADCLLLPHASNRYRLSGSGILFEALLNAIPFICSSGLSFSDYAGNGNAIEAKDDAEFSRAILAFAENPLPFRKGARQSAEAYSASLRSNALLTRIRGAPQQVALT